MKILKQIWGRITSVFSRKKIEEASKLLGGIAAIGILIANLPAILVFGTSNMDARKVALYIVTGVAIGGLYYIGTMTNFIILSLLSSSVEESVTGKKHSMAAAAA